MIVTQFVKVKHLSQWIDGSCCPFKSNSRPIQAFGSKHCHQVPHSHFFPRPHPYPHPQSHLRPRPHPEWDPV